jgi:hypothetical protein
MLVTEPAHVLVPRLSSDVLCYSTRTITREHGQYEMEADAVKLRRKLRGFAGQHRKMDGNLFIRCNFERKMPL